jgi:hypothetical protein
VTGPDSGEGELKLYGSAVQAGPELRGAAACAWWSEHPPRQAVVFWRITTAMFVEWDLEHGMMTVHRWTPRDGYGHSTRCYP